ncbi:MAG TPA: MFS transporter [Methylophilaceae bacterium]|nr:MFS transporter [Methylophilaceae bacterium]
MTKTLHRNLASFYFVYYFFVGVFVPYWALYLQSEQFTPLEIGVLMSLFQISRIFAPNFWGWLADHTAKRTIWIRLNTVLGVLGFIAVFWVQGFVSMLLVMGALSIFTSSTMPLSESLTLAHLAKTKGHYSRIRMWGSVGFIVGSIILGYFIDWAGISSLLWAILVVQVSLFILTFALPDVTVAPHHMDDFSVWKIMRQPAVIALLTGCAMMVTAHGVMYNFYSIYLAEHGYTKGMIGWLWAVGVICEIMVFMWMPKIMLRFSLKTIILASLFLAVLRFTLISVAVDNLVWLLIAQSLHAATFGSFHAATIEVVTYFFNGRHQAKGQAIYNSVTYGLGGAIGGIAGGYALQGLGGQMTFLLAAMFPLIGFAVVAFGLKLRKTHGMQGMFS